MAESVGKRDWMYEVIVSGDWATEDNMKAEVQGCTSQGGELTAWIWEDQGGGEYMAAFELQDWPDEDCVVNAINSASYFELEGVTCEDLNGSDPAIEHELAMQSQG